MSILDQPKKNTTPVTTTALNAGLSTGQIPAVMRPSTTPTPQPNYTVPAYNPNGGVFGPTPQLGTKPPVTIPTTSDIKPPTIYDIADLGKGVFGVNNPLRVGMQFRDAQGNVFSLNDQLVKSWSTALANKAAQDSIPQVTDYGLEHMDTGVQNKADYQESLAEQARKDAAAKARPSIPTFDTTLPPLNPAQLAAYRQAVRGAQSSYDRMMAQLQLSKRNTRQQGREQRAEVNRGEFGGLQDLQTNLAYTGMDNSPATVGVGMDAVSAQADTQRAAIEQQIAQALAAVQQQSAAVAAQRSQQLAAAAGQKADWRTQNLNDRFQRWFSTGGMVQ